MRHKLLFVLALCWLPFAAAQAADTPFRDCAVCPLMVNVPGGSFSMGTSYSEISNAYSDGARAEDIQNEIPEHVVTVKPFAMSVTEVTQDEFAVFVRATGHWAGGPCWVYNIAERHFVGSNGSNWSNPGFNQDRNHPVVCVSWDDAKAYVSWLSQTTGNDYRLPTEAEWEYAARAGTTVPRYWGWDNSSSCRYSNLADLGAADELNKTKDNKREVFQCTDGYVYTAPVALFQANAFGLHDMLGNVWEATEDCYNSSYSGAPTDGSAWLTGECSYRVGRGGSWQDGPWSIRTTNREWGSTTYRANNLGFRVAKTN